MEMLTLQLFSLLKLMKMLTLQTFFMVPGYAFYQGPQFNTGIATYGVAEDPRFNTGIVTYGAA